MLRVAALAVGAVCTLGACGGDDQGAALPVEGTTAAVQEGPVAATELVAGDCLNGVVLGAAERAEISSAEVVSCDRPHALEVFATFELQAADFGLDDPAGYPGPVRVVRAADERCAARIGQLVEDPVAFGLIALWPSQTSWATGDRQVACAVFAPDGARFESRQL